MRDTLKKHTDFLPNENDLNAKSALFFVRATPTKFPNNARYGLVVTKKTFKLAVQRNHAKRLLRDWLRHNENLLIDDLDYIFIARQPIIDASRQTGLTTMQKTLGHIKKIYAEHKQK